MNGVVNQYKNKGNLMNVGPRPATLDKIKRVNKLRHEISVPLACKRVGLSTVYYWRFRKKYPHLIEEVGYVCADK